MWFRYLPHHSVTIPGTAKELVARYFEKLIGGKSSSSEGGFACWK